MTDQQPESVEDMMLRLKKRFKAAGLQTKTESFSEGSMVGDETRCLTQLRTYVKLCGQMGPAFVINEKARHECFDAIKIHTGSVQVLIQALLCLNLLLAESQQDARKSKQITFEVYDGAFGNMLNIAEQHAGNGEFANELVKFIRFLFAAEAVGLEMLKSEDRIQQLLNGIVAAHGAEATIINTAEDIRGLLLTYRNQASSAQEKQAESNDMNRTSTLDDFDDLAMGDLIGLDELGGDLGGDLVGDLGPDLVGGSTPVGGNQTANTMSFANASPMMSTGAPPNGYVPKAQLDEARRTLAQYQIDIQALGQQLSQMTLQYQADKEVHRSFVSRLQESETQYRREKIEAQQKIGTLEQMNSSLQEDLEKVKTELATKDQTLGVHTQRFEQMKTMVTNQMDQARGQYLHLQTEYKNVKHLNATLQETTKSRVERSRQLEEQLTIRSREAEDYQQQVIRWQDKCQQAETELVQLQQQQNSLVHTQNDEHQRLQQQHGMLINQHQNLYQLKLSLIHI